ncbi:MAG TPA: DUF6069 family protein [Thermomicrobiales bacterium]
MSSMSLSPAVATSPSLSQESRVVDWGRFALVGLATVVASGLSTILVYYAGDAVVRYDPKFVELGSAVGDGIFTAVLAIGAVLVYAGLLRFARNPVRTYTIVSAAVLLLSLIPDFTIAPADPGATNAQVAVLVLMHFVAAAVIVPMLVTLARPQGR